MDKGAEAELLPAVVGKHGCVDHNRVRPAARVGVVQRAARGHARGDGADRAECHAHHRRVVAAPGDGAKHEPLLPDLHADRLKLPRIVVLHIN